MIPALATTSEVAELLTQHVIGAFPCVIALSEFSAIVKANLAFNVGILKDERMAKECRREKMCIEQVLLETFHIIKQ